MTLILYQMHCSIHLHCAIGKYISQVMLLISYYCDYFMVMHEFSQWLLLSWPDRNVVFSIGPWLYLHASDKCHICDNFVTACEHVVSLLLSGLVTADSCTL